MPAFDYAQVLVCVEAFAAPPLAFLAQHVAFPVLKNIKKSANYMFIQQTFQAYLL